MINALTMWPCCTVCRKMFRNRKLGLCRWLTTHQLLCEVQTCFSNTQSCFFFLLHLCMTRQLSGCDKPLLMSMAITNPLCMNTVLSWCCEHFILAATSETQVKHVRLLAEGLWRLLTDPWILQCFEMAIYAFGTFPVDLSISSGVHSNHTSIVISGFDCSHKSFLPGKAKSLSYTTSVPNTDTTNATQHVIHELVCNYWDSSAVAVDES